MTPLPSSQFSDVKPALQLHVYEPPDWVQCPPFSHGFGKQGDISSEKNKNQIKHNNKFKSLSLVPDNFYCLLYNYSEVLNTLIIFSGHLFLGCDGCVTLCKVYCSLNHFYVRFTGHIRLHRHILQKECFATKYQQNVAPIFTLSGVLFFF